MSLLDQISKWQQVNRAAAQGATTIPAPAPARPAPVEAAPAVPLSTRLEELANRTITAGAHVDYAEVNRIIGLPVLQMPGRLAVEEFSRKRVLGEALRDGFRLFDTQVAAVQAYEELEGLFAPIGVGWGKTLITLMIAESGFRKFAKRKILLLVPTQVYQQLTEFDLAWARRRVPITVPFIPLGQTTAQRRLAIAQSQKQGCYILPYSCLSTKDASQVLHAIAPSLVILDEAHLVRHRTAARTKRLLAILDECRPKLVALSGTITAKSLMDYHHLIRRCLGEGSPVPLSVQLATEWAAVIDSDAGASDAQTGPIRPLIGWAQTNFPREPLAEGRAGFRRAFRLRLTSAPGVVSTGDNEIGTSLLVSNRPPFSVNSSSQEAEKLLPFAGGALLHKLLSQVENEWVTPNGDELEHAIHAFKWLYELSSGFYNELVWPTPEQLSLRRRITREEATGQLERARFHHVAEQHYHKKLRGWISDFSTEGLDTPMLVGGGIAREDKRILGTREGREMAEAWRAAKACVFDDMPERDSRAIRVCSYKIDAMVRWAQELPAGKGAIVWVYHQEMGEWAHEALVAAGVDALHCPAGAQYDRLLARPVENGVSNKVVVASMSAHGTGKNLQCFQHTYFLQWPRSATMAEQTLGRNHRSGQEAEELEMVLNLSLRFDELVFAACAEDALYIHSTTGNRQKLIYCSYDPMPRMFSSDVLAERGLEPTRLTAAQRRELEEKFGAVLDTA